MDDPDHDRRSGFDSASRKETAQHDKVELAVAAQFFSGPGASERSHVPPLHETRRSAQPNGDMDDLILVSRAQLETARLEQL